MADRLVVFRVITVMEVVGTGWLMLCPWVVGRGAQLCVLPTMRRDTVSTNYLQQNADTL